MRQITTEREVRRCYRWDGWLLSPWRTVYSPVCQTYGTYCVSAYVWSIANVQKLLGVEKGGFSESLDITKLKKEVCCKKIQEITSVNCRKQNCLFKECLGLNRCKKGRFCIGLFINMWSDCAMHCDSLSFFFRTFYIMMIAGCVCCEAHYKCMQGLENIHYELTNYRKYLKEK